MDMLEFGNKLKELRKARHLSQSDLGHIIGVSRATVGSWECGRRNISISDLEKVCNYFKLPIDFFGINTKQNEIIDLLERARALFNSDIPTEDKQLLSEELMRLYLKLKG